MMRVDWQLLTFAYCNMAVAAAGDATVPMLYGVLIDAIAIDQDVQKFQMYMVRAMRNSARNSARNSVTAESLLHRYAATQILRSAVGELTIDYLRGAPQPAQLVLCSGFLDKRSPKTLMGVSAWQTRWFELTPTALTYWEPMEAGIEASNARVAAHLPYHLPYHLPPAYRRSSRRESRRRSARRATSIRSRSRSTAAASSWARWSASASTRRTRCGSSC